MSIVCTTLMGCDPEVFQVLEPLDLDASARDMPPDDAMDSPMDIDSKDLSDLGIAPSRISALAAGRFHTCLIASGALYCWGKNERGALGVGDLLPHASPVRVGLEQDWVSISAALDMSCGLRAGGAVYCWGSNSSGQLGTGQVEPASSPTPQRVPLPLPAIDLSAGSNHGCAILQSGALSCWGSSQEGKLGPEFALGAPEIVPPTPIGARTDWAQVAAGEGHTCALTRGGELYCWGRSVSGALAQRETTPNPTPTRVGSSSDWTQVFASQNTTCATRAMQLYCWGRNDAGQIDVALSDSPVITPTLMGEVVDSRDAVAVGPFGVCRIDLAGTLWCRGRNREGQLGIAPTPQDAEDQVALPERQLEGSRVAVTRGWFHVCASDESGVLWCRGRNLEGQLGTEPLDYVNVEARPLMIP